MTLTDHVLFRMPRDRELQFAAMAVVQEYVNGFQARMETGAPVPAGYKLVKEKAEYRLCYHLEMDGDDIRFFQRIGLDLVQPPEGMDWTPDMVVDLRDERLNLFRDSGKHACQACTVMSGASCPPIPKIWRMRARPDKPWASLLGLQTPTRDNWLLEPQIEPHSEFADKQTPINGQHLVEACKSRLPDSPWIGIIGRAGWETYLAASMGLPVIEIVPPDRPRNWLSKFTNAAYRPVEEAAGFLEDQILQAAHSLEALVAHMTQKEIEAREEQQEVSADV